MFKEAGGPQAMAQWQYQRLLPRAAKTVLQMSSLNNGNVFSHRSAVQKSKIKVWAGSVPSESCEDNLLRASVPVSGGLVTISGIPWLGDPAPGSLPSSSQGILPVSTFPLVIRTTVTLVTSS